MKILLISNGNYFARIILQKLINEQINCICGIVLVNGDYNGYKGIRALYNVGRKTTLLFTMFKIFVNLFFRLKSIIYLHDGDLLYFAKKMDLKYCVSNKINVKKCIDFISTCLPDIIISVSCPQKINKRILDIPKIAALNIHSSLLPKYAGINPYYWVLVNNEPITGITVHYMTENYDEGNIIIQKELPIITNTSVFRLFEELAYLGQSSICESIDYVKNNKKGIKQDLSLRSYYSHPDYDSYKKLKKNGFSLLNMQDIIRILKSP